MLALTVAQAQADRQRRGQPLSAAPRLRQLSLRHNSISDNGCVAWAG
jgi:hypothetical protein